MVATIRVRELQSLLNLAVKPQYQIVVDGVIGKQTRRAVHMAQSELGLVVDGIAGPATIHALRSLRDSRRKGIDSARRVEPDKSGIYTPLPGYRSHNINVIKTPIHVPDIVDTKRFIDEITVHCAATSEGKHFTVKDIRAWHMQRGFSDIGYHFVSYARGGIYTGRPIGQIGAHVLGRNASTIGICYIGGLDASGELAKDTRTLAQVNDLMWLIQELLQAFPSIRRISGHNEYAAKACPSFNVPTDILGNSFGFKRGTKAA